MSKKTDVLILGGGPAGRVVVHALHKAKSGLSVTLVKDEEVNVNRCAIPYGVNTEKELGKFQIPNTLVTDFGAELRIAKAERLLPEEHRVELEGGEAIEYGKLVLATGARPVVPPLPGVDAENVTAVRSLADLDRLRNLAKGAKSAVVIGGGYIGLEVAVSLRELGKEVSVVEMLLHVMQAAAEPEMIPLVEDTLTHHGIRLELGCGVESIETKNGRAVAALLHDGTRLEADLFVLSVGVRPNTELAEAAGLSVSKYGIETDGHLRTSVPDIYAAGDCAETKSFVSGQPVRGEFGTNAVFMGKVVAKNLLGKEATFPGVINAAASRVFDWGIGSAGLTEAAAREAGFNVVTGWSEVLDKYPMMDGKETIRTKLVFDRKSRKLLGANILSKGFGVARNVDFASLAIQKSVTLDDLLVYQYATHPELAAKPSDNTWLFAAMDADAKCQ